MVKDTLALIPFKNIPPHFRHTFLIILAAFLSSLEVFFMSVSLMCDKKYHECCC